VARSSNKLTALSVKKDLKPGLYGDGGGLYLQVSLFDTKAWVFRYMIAGRARKMGLGPVSVKSDDKNVTLASARGMATDARSLVVRGIDPIDDREARKVAQAVERAKTITFGEAAERYIKAHKASWKSPKHENQYRMTLLGIDPKGRPARNDYCGPIRDLPVASIDTALVLKVIEPIWATKTETASRIRGRIETVLSWAKARGYRQGENPAAWRGHLDQLLPAKSQVSPVENHPALPYAELPAFVAHLRSKEGTGARALEFTILTAARTADTIGATGREINLSEKLWTVPSARVKGKKGARKRDHVVTLSDHAIEVLKGHAAGAGDYLFPGDKEGEPLSNAAMAAVIDRMNDERKAAGLPIWIDPHLNRAVVPHGFRSTFLDWGHDITAYPKEMLDIALAHKVSDKVEAAYRRSDMREKRRQLMADWAAYCRAQGGSS
jgi:integrase